MKNLYNKIWLCITCGPMYEWCENKNSDEKKGQLTFTVLFHFCYAILVFSLIFQLKKFKPCYSEKCLYVAEVSGAGLQVVWIL